MAAPHMLHNGGQEQEGGNMYETQIQQPETGACVTSYIAIAENVAIKNEILHAFVRLEITPNTALV